MEGMRVEAADLGLLLERFCNTIIMTHVTPAIPNNVSRIQVSGSCRQEMRNHTKHLRMVDFSTDIRFLDYLTTPFQLHSLCSIKW